VFLHGRQAKFGKSEVHAAWNISPSRRRTPIIAIRAKLGILAN
jgi:hypothetical protein